MRRLPPNKIEQNLNGLLNLMPEETDELLQRIDQPLQEATDPENVYNLQYDIRFLLPIVSSAFFLLIYFPDKTSF